MLYFGLNRLGLCAQLAIQTKATTFSASKSTQHGRGNNTATATVAASEGRGRVAKEGT
jgi:hypothetical protein